MILVITPFQDLIFIYHIDISIIIIVDKLFITKGDISAVILLFSLILAIQGYTRVNEFIHDYKLF